MTRGSGLNADDQAGMDSPAIELKIPCGVVRRSCQAANDVVPTQ